ncbi:MAG: hypothetical protein JW821_06390 [Deltaproteobacteria bacterium]|nr:hypothetical protein [Deltaproteobacteria bacterium]
MKTDEAILAFSQSEKIKAGLIWLSQALEMLRGLPEPERKGGERLVSALLNMVSHEIKLAGTVAANREWEDADPYIERAIAMVESGVGEEAVVHLSRALSRVTNIGQQAMMHLKEEKLL